MRKKFKLYGVKYKFKKQTNNLQQYRYYIPKNPFGKSLWIMVYSHWLYGWNTERVEYITIDRQSRPIRLKFNGYPRDKILFMSDTKKAVEAKVKLYNSYDQALS